jgi:hypothetical protein
MAKENYRRIDYADFSVTCGGTGRDRHAFGSCPICGKEFQIDEQGIPAEKMVYAYITSCISGHKKKEEKV